MFLMGAPVSDNETKVVSTRFDSACYHREMKRTSLLNISALFAAILSTSAFSQETKQSGSEVPKTAVQLPEELRGKWTAALSSMDGGKSYVSMKQEPFSEVSADSVSVLQKTDLSGAKLSVSKVEALPDPKGKANTFMVTFESGERWRIQRNGFNCTYIIYDTTKADAPEKGRIVVKIQK